MINMPPGASRALLRPPRGNPQGLSGNGGAPTLAPCGPLAGLNLPTHARAGNGWERPWSPDTWVLPQIPRDLCPLGQLPNSQNLTFLIGKIGKQRQVSGLSRIK